MRSPRYAPAGLCVERAGGAHDGDEALRVLVDAGPEALPPGRLDAWLVSDLHSELIAAIRRVARPRGVEPAVARFEVEGLSLEPHPVVHTSHPTYGYLLVTHGVRVVWAPEFWRFPRWAAGADLMFAEAASWSRPIGFVGGVGGHMPALEVARRAHAAGVDKLVLAHIGRPSIRARDAGETIEGVEWGSDGDTWIVTSRGVLRER
ncbi:MAG: hypothetical protein HYV09_03870 [Deltaproteobacteria bacterium]|nr:hypothetical protein [Deltaproteobacteria bacterium]